MTNTLATWFAGHLGQVMPAELVIFIVSLLPILECRGGLIVASLLGVKMWTAIPICVLGNVIPVPFILFLIRKVFAFCRRFKALRPIIDKLEDRAMKKSDSVAKGEFLGLLLFVGVPLPGTGAWTGSLIAALLGIDRRKAIVAILLGVALACFIMTVFSYGFLANVVG